MSNKESSTPEWDIFRKIEKTEQVYKQLERETNKLRKELKGMKPRVEGNLDLLDKIVSLIDSVVSLAQDANILATDTFFLAFMSAARWRPENTRSLKDSVMAGLKEKGLSAKTTDYLERMLLAFCNFVEGKTK